MDATQRPLPRLAMVGFVLAGATLRLWNLRGQVPTEAELQWVGRWPSILCGLIALAVIPRMFSGRVERFPVELVGWMMALSPAFVLHSRMALPFMPLALGVFIAFMTLERWPLVGGLAIVAVAAAPFLGSAIPLQTVGDVLRLQAGTRSWVLAILFWAFALVGLGLLLRKNLRLGLHTLASVAGYVAGVFLLAPKGLDDPLVLNRWLLPVLPFVFLWVAMAIGRPWIPRTGLLGLGLQRSAARFFILFLFWTGPFLTKGFRESPVMHHDETLRKVWDLHENVAPAGSPPDTR